MCGIWISMGLDDKAARRALQAVESRGPDGQGLESFSTPSGPLHFGHRRLSIYDLDARANQPMQIEQRRWHIVFNGAIYNFKSLRQELEGLGHVFHTSSDTEVLLKGWREWREALLPRLNGMFAFAVFDQHTGQLILARDRFGEKPLHWHIWRSEGQWKWAAASDPLQLLQAVPDLKRQLDPVRMGQFLDFGNMLGVSETFFKGIKTLPGGHIIVIETNNTDAFDTPNSIEMCVTAWAEVAQKSSLPTNIVTHARDLRDHMRQSVELRLLADVKVGSCLSGGLDSTSIVRLADAKLSASQDVLDCICALYEEQDARGHSLSERPYYEAALQDTNLRGHTISPQSGEVMEAFERIVHDQREPFAHSSVCAQWFVFKEAKAKGLKVMLDGQGADELFAGYPSMIGAYQGDLLRQLKFGTWMHLLQDFGQEGGNLSKVDLLKTSYNAFIPEPVRRIIAKARGTWPPPSMMAVPTPLPRLQRRHQSTSLKTLIHNLLWRDSLPTLLRYEDRNAMAHSIESRLPFLDPTIVNFALNTSSNMLIRDGYMKAILAKSMRNIVPDKIIDRRRKLGFITPQDKWMEGSMGVAAFASLERLQERWPDMFCQATLENIRQNGSRDPRLFRVLSLERWADAFNVN